MDEDFWKFNFKQPAPQQPPTLLFRPALDALSWLNSEQPTLPTPPNTVPTPIPASLAGPSSTSSHIAAPSADPNRLRSCAPCRIRRVKCERAPGLLDCAKCLKKGLTCTPMPVVARKTPVRSGKRIEQARVLFGGAAETNTTPGAGGQKRARQDDLGGTVNLRESSVMGQLVKTELEGALSSSLLDLYCLLPQSRVPMLEGAANFKSTFEACGRRLSSMDESHKVFFTVVLALGSRVSDHPLLVGSSAPTLAELAVAAKEGRDLSEWGRRREAACVALTNKAVALADEKGIWRKPNTSNIATLIMLEGLLDQQAGQITENRPYSDAYMSHLRVMLERGLNDSGREKLLESGIGWGAFCRDATLSATSGRQPSFSDDDVETLFETTPRPLPLEIAIMSPAMDLADPVNVRQKPFWTIFESYMVHLAEIARRCPQSLTGRRARLSPRINEPFAWEFLTQLDLATRGGAVVEARAMAFLGPPESESCTETSKAYWGFVRNLRLTNCTLSHLLNRVVRNRLRARYDLAGTSVHEISETGTADDEDEYWARLEQLEIAVAAAAFDSTKLIIKIFAETLESGIALGVMSGTSLLYAHLPFWLQIHIDTPVAEEGGPSGFTFTAKLNDLRVVLKSLYIVGWAFERLSRPAPWLAREIEVLELREAEYRRRVSMGLVAFGGQATPGSGSGASSVGPPLGAGEGMSEADIEAMLTSLTAGLYEPSVKVDREPEGDPNAVLRMFAGVLS